MEISFVQPDDDDDVRLRKKTAEYTKGERHIQTHTHIFVLMLLWTLFGRLLSYLRRCFVTKEVTASMQQHFP